MASKIKKLEILGTMYDIAPANPTPVSLTGDVNGSGVIVGDGTEAIINVDASPVIGGHNSDASAHQDIRELIDIKIQEAFSGLARAEEVSW